MITCQCISVTCIIVVFLVTLLLVGYIFVRLVACIILVGLISSIIHSCLILHVYAHVWMVMDHLCMFMFACGQCYNDAMMVVIMHEVMVCVFVEVMH